MTDLQTKQLAFLKETIAHYNSNNRATRAGTMLCQYSPVEGRTAGCAIGRHIPDKELCAKLDKGKSQGVSEKVVFKKLPAKLKALGAAFLSRMQALHDGRYHWSENGISEFGEREVESIKKEFGLNEV